MKSSIEDLGVITCYYNPSHYQTKRDNYDRFITALKKNPVAYRVVECAFVDAPFELPRNEETIQVRGQDVMWQKERLLNLALEELPESCTKVAWLDCDLVFEDPLWMTKASAALETSQVIQPFTSVVRLPRNPDEIPEGGDTYRSLAAVQSSSAATLRSGNFSAHGHTGFAWAACRDWLSRHGFYDVCITGSSDHLMAHAFYGDTDSKCIYDMLGPCGPYRQHFEKWAAGVYEEVRGQVGFIPGRLLHLWHGDVADRHYHLRNRQLQQFAFDPNRDLSMGSQGVWEWATRKTALHHWSRAFFPLRNEDGVVTFVHSPQARNG